MNIGAVILSRYSSSRLPGKALMKINEYVTLEYIIERLTKVLDKDNIVVATSNDKSDDKIAELSNNLGVNCFRGSLTNVSERFYLATVEQNWDYTIRINGDNILVDTNILSDMISITKNAKFDFISNVPNRTFPEGMSIEIIKTKYYGSTLNNINFSDYHKEHVTSYLYEYGTGKHHYIINKELPKSNEMKLALDTQEDFDRIRNIILKFNKPHWMYNLHEIYEIWKGLENE